MKALHAPHHKIPTVKWNHWGKKNAILCSLEELNGLQASPSESSGTTGQATQSRDVSDGRPT